MSLFFLHPIYLYGLIATLIPALIHLLNRRRLKRIRFPAVRFVLLSQRRISRTYRLRHWLLLALRTFAIFLLVLLLAHPIFHRGVGLLAGGGPLSLVVILDNSLSMKWSGEGDGFNQAKKAVRGAVSSLNEGDQVALIPTNARDWATIRFKADKDLLAKELDAIPLAAGSADFSVALKKAYGLLREPESRPEIWLVTDMALTDWDPFSLAAVGEYDPSIPLKIIRLGAKAEAVNATIKELRLDRSGLGVGLPTRVTAVLVNFTEKEIKEVLVRLSLNDQRREQKLVTLPPKGELAVDFQFTLSQPGAHYGRVTLQKEGLAGNPASYFVLQAEDKLKILIVDGDPQTSLVQSETFFLTHALNPSGEGAHSILLPTVIIPEGLSSVSLDSYQALIFCNVPAIPRAVLPRLRDYLLQGGGVLLFLGDRVQAEDYNLKLFQSAPPILPARITDKRTLSEGTAEKIVKIDFAHPALQRLSDQNLQDSLRASRIRGYFRADVSSGSPLLALANGDPLLIEKKLGSGRLLLFTTAADRDWSDLPLKVAYLPLMQSAATYLSGGKGGMADPGIPVGGTKSFSLPPSHVGRGLRVVKPDGKEREVAAAAAAGKAVATFQENDLAGIYRLAAPSPLEVPSLAQLYAVNSPFLESRLEQMGEKELESKLNPIRAEVIPVESLEKGGTRLDLAFPLLFLLIMTLASEGWLAQRF